jgi:dihydropteroate synthase
MGVLNVTPDSFSDGGRYLGRDAALAHAQAMVQAGAKIIDVGGESTRPGAAAVSVTEELDRVAVAVEAIAAECDVVISVDTSSPQVMRQAAALGAGMINDVRALVRPGAVQVAAETGLAVCLMHMQGEPETMQQAPVYDDVVAQVEAFLVGRVNACVAGGIERSKLVLDPGFGFGKTDQHNLALLDALPQMAALGLPVLAGLSRKSMIGRLLGKPVADRLIGSVILAVLAAQRGARILRVHDVAETVDALTLLRAINQIEARQG